MTYSVSEIAKTAGVSVRTLHHYDHLGLVSPSFRSGAGYREYEVPDLERLQEVLFYKELGLPLKEIQTLLEKPEADRSSTLSKQRGLLTDKVAHLELMINAIDDAQSATTKGTIMDKNDLLEVFGDFDPSAHEAEAEERWTDTYRESARRTSNYTKDDWTKIKAEISEIEHGLAALMAGGVPADSADAMDLAERARLHTDKYFYPMDKVQHTLIGQMYVDDPRFAERYNKIAKGLSTYLRDAFAANGKQ